MTTLDKIPNLIQVTIKGFKNDVLPIKLFELGLFPEVNIKIIQKAPLGGMYLIEIQNEESRIAIQKEIAQKIIVRINELS